MNASRNHVVTAVSLVILISLFVMTRSNTSYVDATKEVKVINTASEPVPVTGTTTLSGPIQAAQSGAWNIGINSSAASPVLVRDVDNPARQAFQQFRLFFFGDGVSNNSITVTTVPQGKRLVIEHVSFLGFVPSGQGMRGAILTTVNSQFASHELALTESQFGSLETHFITDHTTRIYADSGTDVVLFSVRSFPHPGGGGVNATISGHFVDMP